MQIEGRSVMVTGGASGLGLATARRLVDQGALVTVVDLPGSAGDRVAEELSIRFVSADVTDENQVRTAIAVATSAGPLRAVVHCAGGPGRIGVLDADGQASPKDDFDRVVALNLGGSFNVLRLAAEAMAATDPVDGERGVCVLTSSIAAYEGQIGQVSYAASKAGIVGMTLASARDLADRLIRVCTIAPGLFGPLLSESAFDRFAGSIPHPNRLGHAPEFALLATQIIENPMLNGETIRLDAAARLPGR